MQVISCSESAPTQPMDAAVVMVDAPEVVVPPVPCGTLLSGTPMAPGLVESAPGYIDELTALSPTLPTPYSFAGISQLQQSVVNYMLGRSVGTDLTTDLIVAAGPLGRAITGAVNQNPSALDFRFLRRGLHYFSPCARPFPKDLSTLVARHGNYKNWASRIIACSAPKNGPRRIFENPEQTIAVAETMVGAAVRETEVIFTGLRSDTQLDFAVYTEAGLLTDRSTFATANSSITLAAPYTCLTCHSDSTTRLFTDRTPTGTGAGCRTVQRGAPIEPTRFDVFGVMPSIGARPGLPL